MKNILCQINNKNNDYNIESWPDIIAVVPAAGNGSRMHSKRPKQYLAIGYATILEHSVTRLLAHPAINKVIIVLSSKDNYFQYLPIAKDSRILTVIGGDQRADSVLAGLTAIKHANWVLVHDAVRPCLATEDLQRLLEISRHSHVGGILAVPVHDTIKRSMFDKDKIAYTVERKALWHALTPQLFPLELLYQCLTRALNDGASITDEASALEYCDYHPELIIGRSDNIKITNPEDLALATCYLSKLYDEEYI